MKKRLSAISIIILLVVLSVTTVLAVKPELIFNFKYNPKQNTDSTKSDIKQNKLIKEEYDDKTKISNSSSLQKSFGVTSNDFSLKKEKLNTEDLSEAFSYIAPTGLAIDIEGTIYVDDPANNAIKKIDSSGNVIESISIKAVTDSSNVIDWGVTKNGFIYLLTNNGLFRSTDNQNKSFINSQITFNNPQRLYVSNKGNISVLDINNETMNLRVQKISESDELISSFEQYNEELNLFDFEDSYGNIAKINLIGGSCDDELQYAITNTAYPEKEFLVSFNRENGDSIKGITVIGFDNNQNIYFLKEVFKTNSGNSKTDIDNYIDIFSFSDYTMHNYSLGKGNSFKVQGLSRHSIITNLDGSIYQLQTDEKGITINKYSIDQK